MTRPETRNSQAYDLYLKGRYAWSQRGRDNVAASIADFKEAIVADPMFALAYSGLADAYSVAPPYGVSMPKEAHTLALAAAGKAIELEPNLAEAHAAMGAALAHTRQWEAAEKEFKRSLQLNPNNASAHYLYAFETLTPMKRLDEAAPQYRAALEIDPLSPIINGNYGVFLFMRHKYDESLQQLKKAMELQPSFTVTSLRIGDLLALKGDFRNAIAQRHAYFPKMIIPENSDARSYGQATLDAIDKLGGYQPYYLTAEAWVWVGDSDKAFEYLRRGCDEQDNLEPVFLRSPAFDPIRSDPRYIGLTQCLKIPE
jgi:Tfp pilus assembly protein PilF